ncbi:MAG: type II toxin-antitoxin system VapC family toxin [Microbacteriaceae bacterium]|nr:type II toxin-antitoxin system VapC family toxin [Microbacteriaceae bacterium]
MTFVLDAALTLAWFFPAERSPMTEAILGKAADDDVVVPSIWVYELANRLSREVAASAATGERVDAFLAMLGDLALEVASPSLRGMLDSAVAHDLTAYDAAYLEIADARRIALATLDRRLRAAAEKIGVALLPESLD